MRKAWPDEKPMSVRISATDWKEGGLTGDDAVEVARAFAEAGCDLIDVSTGQTVHDAEPMFGRMFQTPFSDQIRNEAGLATMCVGAITSADQVNTIVAAGRADLVALARPHLVDPFFTMKAAAWYGATDIHCPPQYLSGPRPDLPQLGARPRRPDAAQAEGEAEGARGRGVEAGGGVNPSPEGGGWLRAQRADGWGGATLEDPTRSPSATTLPLRGRDDLTPADTVPSRSRRR